MSGAATARSKAQYAGPSGCSGAASLTGMLSAAAVKARDYDRLTLQIAQRALAGGGSGLTSALMRGKSSSGWSGCHLGRTGRSSRSRLVRHAYAGGFLMSLLSRLRFQNFNGTAEFRFLPRAAGYSS